MKKVYLIFGLCSLSLISVAQDKWDTDGNNGVSNNAKLGPKNNKGFKIITNDQTSVDVENNGRFNFKKAVNFENALNADSIYVSKYLRADSIKTRILKVGNNSLILGGFPQTGNDNIQSTTGKINIGGNPTFANVNLSIGTSPLGGFNPLLARLFVSGRTGMNINNPLSTLGISGNQAIGASFGGLNAPANGMIIEGFSGIGTSNPIRQLEVFTPAITPQMRVTRFVNTHFTDISTTTNGDYILLPTNTTLPVAQRPRFVGIQTNTPGNTLEINSQATSITPGASGLRFTDLTSGSNTVTNVSGKVLSVNNLGDVVLVPDGGGAGPAVVTAKNGLNVTFGPPDVELGGTLLHNTDVNQNGNNLVWNGTGQFGIGTGLANSNSFNSTYNARFELNDNTVSNSMYIVNTTSGGAGGIIMDILSTGPTNYGHLVTVKNAQNNIGVSSAAIGAVGSNINQGIVSTAIEGKTLMGGILTAQTTDPNTSEAWGALNQLFLNQPLPDIFQTRRAASASQVVGKSIWTKYGSVATTDLTNDIKNVAMGGIVGTNGINTIDICNGTSVKNIAVYGAFFDPTPFNPYNSQTSGNYAGYFDGDVVITQALTVNNIPVPSDINLKTNIDTISNAIATLKLLQPKQFYYDTTKYFLKKNNQKQYGLIAQQVQSVLPELINSYSVGDRKDTLGNVVSAGGTYKNLNYTALIGILIKGVQEQQRTIDSIRTALSNTASARVINPVNNPNSAASVTTLNKQTVTLSNVDMLVLDQNQPNPFSESTVIKYNVPEKYGYAQLIFRTIEGRILKTIDITKKGAGEITVYANDLSNGIYTYTLVVDGKTVDTKKMIKQN